MGDSVGGGALRGGEMQGNEYRDVLSASGLVGARASALGSGGTSPEEVRPADTHGALPAAATAGEPA